MLCFVLCYILRQFTPRIPSSMFSDRLALCLFYVLCYILRQSSPPSLHVWGRIETHRDVNIVIMINIQASRPANLSLGPLQSRHLVGLGQI